MPRSELAELVAEHVWRHHGVRSPIDRKYLGRLEAGEIRWPNARYRRALREILGAETDDDLGFRCTNVTRPAEDLDRREMLRAAAGTFGGLALTGREGAGLTEALGAAGQADASVAAHLGALVHELRRADDTAPTGSLLPVSAGLVALARQFTSAATGRDQVEVGRAAAEAAMLHWWLMVDAGRDGRTQHEQALNLALHWGFSPLVGHLLGWRGGLALAAGDLPEAVRLTRMARDPSWGVSAGGRAWAAAYEARAHVLAGDDDAAARALDDAQVAYAAVDPESEPPWLYWLVGPMLALDALDMQLLRDGPDAAPALDAALADLPSERARDAAWYRAHIAVSRARAGDLDGAARDTEAAARLSVVTGTTWTLAELTRLSGEPHLAVLRAVLADVAGAGG